MNNSSVTPDLYSKAGTERLFINGLTEVSEGLELPLGFSLNADAFSETSKTCSIHQNKRVGVNDF